MRPPKNSSNASPGPCPICAAIRELPQVLILEDDNLSQPFRKVAESENGRMMFRADPLPQWLAGLLE